jgi:hypothetical protein
MSAMAMLRQQLPAPAPFLRACSLKAPRVTLHNRKQITPRRERLQRVQFPPEFVEPVNLGIQEAMKGGVLAVL